MCGIVGLHLKKSKYDIRELIEQMNAAQIHRGPDDFGTCFDINNQVGLGMRRLAIIDPVGGKQPMVSADGRYSLIFNGEIFNAAALRTELNHIGIFLESNHSDTEVLFKLLQRHGLDSVRRLNGMFAFLFYDRFEKKIYCARDRMGIKPLYYANTDIGVLFASELKSILASSLIERTLNPQATFDYLSLLYVPGTPSIVDKIQRLPQASILEYDISKSRLTIKPYWKLEFIPDLSVRGSEWPERIRDEFSHAVRRWAISDGPVGVSLSGGLDSSAIVGAMASNGMEVNTYSLGFSDVAQTELDELPLARLVSQKWQTNHNETVMQAGQLIDDLDAMVSALDEPYGGGLPSWYVFKEMAKDVKVGLTGTGGDELFGNYGKWIRLERIFPGLHISRKASSVDFRSFNRDFFEKWYYFSLKEKNEVFCDSFIRSADTSRDFYSKFISLKNSSIKDAVALMDISTQLPDEFLHMTDRFSMFHSIEARTPFLDNDFVDLVRTIPDYIRTSRFDFKGLMRASFAPLLPQDVLAGKKRGFTLPISQWLRTTLRDLCQEMLNADKLKSQGIFRPSFYYQFVVPHLNGSADHGQRIWAILMFQLWYRKFNIH